MKKYSTIFFDLDDTLWDTGGNMRECLEDIYTEYDISRYYVSFDSFFKVYSSNNLNLWDRYSKNEISKEKLSKERFIAPFRNIEAVSDEHALEMNEYYLSNICRKERTMDGTIELLEYLKPKYKLHIISNGFTELQYSKIESAGLTGYFEHIFLSDRVGVNKPHPDIFSHALSETRTRRDEAIMIGDNLYADIGGAANSDIDQIWYNPNNMIVGEIEPTHIVVDLLEIKDIL